MAFHAFCLQHVFQPNRMYGELVEPCRRANASGHMNKFGTMMKLVILPSSDPRSCGKNEHHVPLGQKPQTPAP